MRRSLHRSSLESLAEYCPAGTGWDSLKVGKEQLPLLLVSQGHMMLRDTDDLRSHHRNTTEIPARPEYRVC